MGILGASLARRENAPLYRTVDGGHPAPFPDMTDEQLYNYEVAFNVHPRTFAYPPRGADFGAAMNSAMSASVKQALRERETPSPEARIARERLRRNRSFDAPRYTARKPSQEAPKAGTIDFDKPVRTITTKQPVDIITTRARHPIYKVHAYIGDNDVVSVFTLDGRLSENGPQFLENVPQPRPLHLNIYEGTDGSGRYRITQHATREEADAAAQPGRLTCVEVKVEA